MKCLYKFLFLQYYFGNEILFAAMSLFKLSQRFTYINTFITEHHIYAAVGSIPLTAERITILHMDWV